MTDHDFDIAVTFAGEDREFVDEVVKLVKATGMTVFYDEDAKVEMWGEDLTEFFADVYERRARYAVMFVSAHYAAKAWTRHERRSVLVRAIESPTPYLLPVRLDSTTLPGVRSTVAYLDGLAEGPAGVAKAVQAKVGASRADGERRFNGRVPRSPAEAAILLGERPRAWEYIAFSYWLSAGLEQRRSAYNDHVMRFALGGEFISTDALPNYVNSEMARILSITETFESLLLGPAQDAAMGAPGEPGDADLIEHLAGRMLLIFDELLAWAYRLRSASTPTDEGRAVLRAAAEYAAQPVEAVREFIIDLQNRMDVLTETLDRGETVSMQLTIAFDITEEVSSRHQAALDRFGKAQI
ncbi:TIR domain-containing protein [Curtobacterium sp. MCSS17_015]|uniref:toll/interleukin-1 receptor domain-containing protein n=1 Tax=Curtobacterium sp. MCSS17_015 TaxID=2175666 RepID=UPI0011B4017D|nr:TIR domain-containing protein [Curtobacterium sp. MCSS17_015]WIB27872.1 TIR domain-containing protein [Curtobacterium sp. MCSS17_015]